ncbi:hypothetical protein Avbf_17811 [Armadillidium vulgare]|nr:hypothetical protein Avbf_17811 [Armadillidium vulgare]
MQIQLAMKEVINNNYIKFALGAVVNGFYMLLLSYGFNGIELSYIFFRCLGNEAILVTKNDEVYSMGFNGSGCLGVGDQTSTMIPREIEPLCSRYC